MFKRRADHTEDFLLPRRWNSFGEFSIAVEDFGFFRCFIDDVLKLNSFQIGF